MNHRSCAVLFAAALLVACSDPAGRDAPVRFARTLDASRAPVRFAVDPASGTLTALRGRYPIDGTLEGARAFLREHGASFGIEGSTTLHLLRTVDSPGGLRFVFEQHQHGVPIFDGEVVVGLDLAGDILHVTVNPTPDGTVDPSPDLDSAQARGQVREVFGEVGWRGRAERLVFVKGDRGHPGWRLCWQVEVILERPAVGSWWLFFDARDGSLVRRIDRRKFTGPPCTPCNPATDSGCGSLFFTTPVDGLDDLSLRDADNVDAVQQPCVLENLVSATRLTGRWANTSRTAGRVGPPYVYLRSVNESALDELTTYYHVDRSKRHLEAMGYPGVMAYSIDIDARDLALGDNAYYDQGTKELHFGDGGVDDGQAIDVIYHEYGHAIQDDQVPGFGTSFLAGAMGEGFSDYWAAALTDTQFTTTLGAACVGAWDATSYDPYTGRGTGCLRRMDGTKTYPRDLVWEVHDDGEIWAAGLWDLRAGLGAAIADALVIEAHTLLTPSASMRAGADALLSADAALNGGTNAGAIHLAMRNQGISRTGTPASTSGMSSFVTYVCETDHDYTNLAYTECRYTVPNADRVRFRFSRLDTESGYDYVLVSDGDYLQVAALSGTPFGASSGFSAAVAGDTIVARFKTDPSVVDWGFRIDRVYYSAPACTGNASCDDGDPCNGAETCSAGVCSSGTPLTCDDGSFCNGAESCTAGVGCVSGAPPEVDDGVGCTVDACDEANNVVTHLPDPSVCDDGLFCNGTESCDLISDCVSGTPPTVSDGLDCTVDACDEQTRTVTHIPDDGRCDDGAFCNGTESCDLVLGCLAGTAPPVDDGVGCTADRCDEGDDRIVHTPDDLACDDGLFCNGAEFCNTTFDCLPGTPPNVDDGVACTLDDCDEAVAAVIHVPDDGRCDDGAFCNGSERCDPTAGCLSGRQVVVDDGDRCTLDRCDDSTGQVVHAPNPSCESPPPMNLPEPTGTRGCGCDASHSGPLGWGFVLLALGPALWRRRWSSPPDVSIDDPRV